MKPVTLVTLDPGHFHAALIQKEMYPGVSKRAWVYAPLGPDVAEHVHRIARFNSRKENPTAWELEIHCSAGFLPRMLEERPGNVVVLAGRNRGKIDYIKTSIEAGFHVLADKPWIIVPGDLPKLESALATAARSGLIAYDIMTERYEVTSILQRELVNDPEVFGEIVPGSADEPGVRMESVHHLMKMVAGAPLRRPPWFFDIHQQGEALADVGTHLVDLAQWTLFPEQAIDYRADIELIDAARWPTTLSRDQFRRITGEAPESNDDRFDYFCNNRVRYALRGVHVRLDVLWNYEAPEGAGDTHFAVYRGTKSRVEVRQGREESYRPELYVVPGGGGLARAVRSRIEALQPAFPGVAVEELGSEMRIAIPDAHRIGHEAHFAQVARRFFEYLDDPRNLPEWEAPNMLAKYFVTARGVELSREKTA